MMVAGDPYRFSILVKTIDQWNTDRTFCNGILLLCIDSKIFPNKIISSTLACEIPQLKEKLMYPAVDNELFFMEKEKAFSQIYNITFPENVDVNNNYCFDVSPPSFSDNNCYVFAVSNGEQVRIMAAELKYIVEQSRHELKNIDISETFITIDELAKIVSELEF